MEITEVRIKIMEEPGERLKAFCSITIDDCFVIRDLKIIEGTSGPFVAMPSRKLTSHCHVCGMKNHLRARYCNDCGQRLDDSRAIRDSDGRAKLYADIAHPINSSCREQIQDQVVEEYYLELDRARQPGYISRYDDYDLPPEESTPPKTAGGPKPMGVRVDRPHASSQVQGHQPPGSAATPPEPHSGGPHDRPDRNASSQDVHSPQDGSPRPDADEDFGAGIFGESDR